MRPDANRDIGGPTKPTGPPEITVIRVRMWTSCVSDRPAEKIGLRHFDWHRDHPTPWDMWAVWNDHYDDDDDDDDARTDGNDGAFFTWEDSGTRFDPINVSLI